MIGRLQASIWWCGDDVCDCHQPIIEAVWPNEWDSRFVRRWKVWEGSFKCEGDVSGMWEELQEAAERFGIPLTDEHDFGTLEGVDVTKHVEAYAHRWPHSMKAVHVAQ